MNARTLQGLTLLAGTAALTAALSVACSISTTDPGPGGTGGTGTDGTSTTPGGDGTSTSPGSTSTSTGAGSKFQSCKGGSSTLPGTCTQSDVDNYGSCVQTACDSNYKTCFGSDYANGNFTGPCGTYITCAQKCACGDTACVTACSPSSECTTCEQGIATCSKTCTVPACYTSLPDSGTGGATHTCADLQACCAGESGDAQTTCNSYYDNVKASGDVACNAIYSVAGCK